MVFVTQSGGSSDEDEVNCHERCSDPEQHQHRRQRQVTWSNDGPDSCDGAPQARAPRSVSREAESLSQIGLPDERNERLDEMIALLPALKAMVEERGTTEVVDTDNEVQNLQLDQSPRSVLKWSEEDREMEESSPAPPDMQDRKRSAAVSVMQHQSKGLGAARRFSDDSSSDDGDTDGATLNESANKQDYVKLSRDVYSLLYYSVPRSIAFAFSILTYCLQMFILSLFLADSVNLDNPDNPLGIPAGVDSIVRAAQCVAILIAVATQDDLITAINEFFVGYYREALSSEGCGGARWQWLLSITTRFSQGGLCLTATFVLILQSEDVVGLFLDFLAVSFVSTLDDIMFALAREGYFAQRLETEARKMSRLRVSKRQIKTHLFRPLLFLLVSVGMLMGWGIVTSQQLKGAFIQCTSIAVQFGDSIKGDLAFFSGVYVVSHFDTTSRPVYVERSVAGNTGREGKGILAYCNDLGSWTFSYPPSQHEVADPCHWYAITEETDTYDIIEMRPTDFYVFNQEANQPVPFQHFAIRCANCDHVVGRGTSCSGVGSCVVSQCVCDPGRIGTNCEYEEPCESIEINTEFGGFPGPRQWSERYSLLRHCNSTELINVYGRPVYTSDHDSVERAQVILFTGRRWVVTVAQSLIQLGEHVEQNSWCQLSNALKSFHARWDSFTPEFISSPTDVGTPTDSATPVGLDWYRSYSRDHGTDIDIYAPVSTRILCARCTGNIFSNPCKNNGTCNKSTGKCKCKAGTFGSLCQIKSFSLCRSIAVRMEDAVGLSLDGLSGLYHLLDGETLNGRVIYVDVQRRGGIFAFCEEALSWTFTIFPDRHGNASWVRTINAEMFDPCDNWTAISPHSESYDISTAASDWLVRRSREASEGIPLSNFLLWCNDCNQHRNPCNGAGTCAFGGDCFCDENRFGVNCGLSDPCEQLVVDMSTDRLGPSTDGQDKRLPGSYDILRNQNYIKVIVNSRPVYFGSMTPGNNTRYAKTSYALILFTSCRWYTIVTTSFPALNNGTTTDDLAHFLSNDFHAYFSSYSARYISEAVCNVALPTSLKWYVSDPFTKRPADPDKPIGAKMYCAQCDDTAHPCYNGGVCIDGECSCPLGSYGSQCQINSICKSLIVAFGNGVDSEIRLRSGVYDLSDATTEYSDRPVYTLQGAYDAMIAYCVELGHWTFTVWDAGEESLADVRPCVNFYAKSSWTYSFDILSVPSWFVRTNGSEFVAALPATFSYACNDPYYVTQMGVSSYPGQPSKQGSTPEEDDPVRR